MLDLFTPDGAGPFPTVLWSHGSGWMSDNGRDGADTVFERLGPHGFAVAGVAVRSSSQAGFPAQLHDVHAAVAALRADCAKYRLDPDGMAFMGESSGGWAAVMAAVHAEDPVRAAVAFYPPTDFLAMDAQMPAGATEEFDAATGNPLRHDDAASPESRLLGAPIQDVPAAARQASPVTHAAPGCPPVLILHGRLDRFVPYGQGEALYRALAASGGDTELITLPYGRHGQWQEFLADAEVKRGATTLASRDGRVAAGPLDPGWDTIVEFLNRALAGGRTRRPSDASGPRPGPST